MSGTPPMRSSGERQRILEAAAHNIAEHGFHGMSMRRLATAWGKSLAALYNYFPSKDDILYALQREAFETLIASARETLAGFRDPNRRLYAFVLHHIRYFTDHPDVMRVLVYEAGTLPPPRRREIRRLKEGYFRIGREILEDLLEDGCGVGGAGPAPAGETADDAELERIAYSLFGMLNWIYGWYGRDAHGEPQDLARTIHRILLCGIIARCPYRDVQETLEAELAGLPSQPLLGAVGSGGGA
ncbi:MAG: TetR/AcrR family transcriptional regulator [Gemmatimonadota bacterium]